ncbi:MAG: AbrB/MazE/SpoVT family DNA-binding domain-containing protein [Ignisphaera sp.]|nr:AbrB/MazE/SpoVT family DNA-binding domain-containing protein [Ignisphaera sp.]MDW8085086.1 AbrB/MazE/SpoVT family DNA-binding domain-containing protein [Ignisphaera sp.]
MHIPVFSDVVKVDSKGRITIPAALRLLLNISDGEKLVLIFDEDNNKIEIRLPRQGDGLVCNDIVSKDVLLELLKRFDVSIVSCRCKDDHCALYHCKIFIELNGKRSEFAKRFPNIKCTE